MRRDISPRAGPLIFTELGVSTELPLVGPKKIALKLDVEGEFGFSYQKGMCRDWLIVR